MLLKVSQVYCVHFFICLSQVATMLHFTWHSELKMLMQALMPAIRVNMLRLLLMHIYHGNISEQATGACYVCIHASLIHYSPL